VAIGDGGGAGEVTGDGDSDGLILNIGADWDRGGVNRLKVGDTGLLNGLNWFVRKESGTKRGLSVVKADAGEYAVGVVGVESVDIQRPDGTWVLTGRSQDLTKKPPRGGLQM
jgi:hypothetical protein